MIRQMATTAAFLGLLAGGCSQEEGAASSEVADGADLSVGAETARPENPPSAKQSGTGLCSAGEAPLFSCTVTSGKIASVCETKSPAGKSFAQYRYGAAGAAPELAFPLSPEGAQLRWASVAYSGGGEAQIGFERGATTYVVFSRMVRTNFAADEPNNPEITDGVMVLQGGKSIATHRCNDDPLPIDYDRAEQLLEKSADLFTYEAGE